MDKTQKKLFRSYIMRSNYENERALAKEVLNITGVSFSRKVNGHNEFTALEIQKLKEKLNSPDKDVIAIFLR